MIEKNNVFDAITSPLNVLLRPSTPSNSFGIEDVTAQTHITNADLDTISTTNYVILGGENAGDSAAAGETEAEARARPRLVPPAPMPPAADLRLFALISTLRANTLAGLSAVTNNSASSL